MHTSRVQSRRRPTPPFRCASAEGFTLIELMMTVALIAVLLVVAAPAMTKSIRSNRIQTEASSLVGDMQFARTEAVKRGYNVSVCPSTNGTSCLATNTWQSGWMVFSDRGTVGTFDTSAGANDQMLRFHAPLLGGDTAVAYVGSAAAAPTNNYVTFNREGFASGTGTGTTMFKFNTPGNDVKAKRCVSIDLTGRLTTVTDGIVSMLATC